MAAYLAMIENHGQQVRQQTNHGQHHQRPIVPLMDRGPLEIPFRGHNLKHFRVDGPPAPAELVDEQRRNAAENEIAGINPNFEDLSIEP